MAQKVKNRLAMQENWLQDLLEKGVANHSSILAWRIPWTEELSRLRFIGSQRVGHNPATNTHKRRLSDFLSGTFREGEMDGSKRQFLIC